MAEPTGLTLVVVESPATARTLRRWLAPDHLVRATLGHLFDLPAGRLGFDASRGYRPEWQLLRGKSRLLSELRREARSAARVLVATDPDREGEAIAWHLAEALGAPGGDERVRRVLLRELTPDAIRLALDQAGDFDRGRFEAQQARRILDRLVGFRVSPLLWRRVRRGLSAGRVQSAALQLVVERERARQAFRPVGSYQVVAALGPSGRRPALALQVVEGGRPAAWARREEAEAGARALGGATFTVVGLVAEGRDHPPPAPLTTAALLQSAARRLDLAPRRTMALAQRLYEGIDLADEGRTGLVTYPRTDACWVSPAAAAAARAHLEAALGVETVAGPAPASAHPQGRGAHEAIRPTSLAWPPERLAAEPALARQRDLVRLYRLIWDRFLASQLGPALTREVTATLAAEVDGRTVARFQLSAVELERVGWLAADPDGAEAPEPLGRSRSGLALGQRLPLAGVAVESRMAQPPERYGEATLVEALEARGLGRPSTFASIVDTLQVRRYVARQGRVLHPTELGWRVAEALESCLTRQLDVGLTAGLEAALDLVEAGRADWRDVVARFDASLREALAAAEGGRDGHRLAPVACPRCGRPMVERWGHGESFLGCSGYPACRHTAVRVAGESGSGAGEQGSVPAAGLGVGAREGADVGAVGGARRCPRCGSPMVERRGRSGRFLSCAALGGCGATQPVPLDLPCPLGCGGEILERRSHRRRTFFGCSTFPACGFVAAGRPALEPCPDCGAPYLLESRSPRHGSVLACPHRACGYRRPSPTAVAEDAGGYGSRA